MAELKNQNPDETPKATADERAQNATEKSKMIVVKAAVPGKYGAWERDVNHPDGEARVLDEPTEVFPTPYMQQRIAQGHIVQVDGEDFLKIARDNEQATIEANRTRLDTTAAQVRERLEEDANDLERAAVFHDSQAHAIGNAEESKSYAQAAREKAAELRQKARDATRIKS